MSITSLEQKYLARSRYCRAAEFFLSLEAVKKPHPMEKTSCHRLADADE